MCKQIPTKETDDVPKETYGRDPLCAQKRPTKENHCKSKITYKGDPLHVKSDRAGTSLVTPCVCFLHTYTKETLSVSKETSKRIRLCVQRNRAGTSLITPHVCLWHTYTNTYYCFIVTEQGCCSCPNKGVHVHTYKHRSYIHRCMDTCININIYIHICIWYMHL